jgi:integrase
VYLGRGPDGTKSYRAQTIRGTYRDAERELSRLLADLRERPTGRPPVPFGDVLDRWLVMKRHHVEPTTFSSYEWISRTYIRSAFADRLVTSLSALDLDGLYVELQRRGLSAQTVRRCHTVLRQSLAQAQKWGFIERNPAVDATPPPAVHHEVRPPTARQVGALIDVARFQDPAFGTYLRLLATTGCRRGEGCALRWSDIDLGRREVLISRSITHVGSEMRETDTKSHRSRRVTLDEGTAAMLATHKRSQLETSIGLRGLGDDAYVFSDAAGRPWRPDVCTNRFARLRSTLHLDDVRLHDLRHFVATTLSDGGLPIATVSARLGHRDAATTLNVYTHAQGPADQRAAAYIEAALTTT